MGIEEWEIRMGEIEEGLKTAGEKEGIRKNEYKHKYDYMREKKT